MKIFNQSSKDADNTDINFIIFHKKIHKFYNFTKIVFYPLFTPNNKWSIFLLHINNILFTFKLQGGISEYLLINGQKTIVFLYKITNLIEKTFS